MLFAVCFGVLSAGLDVESSSNMQELTRDLTIKCALLNGGQRKRCMKKARVPEDTFNAYNTAAQKLVRLPGVGGTLETIINEHVKECKDDSDVAKCVGMRLSEEEKEEIEDSQKQIVKIGKQLAKEITKIGPSPYLKSFEDKQRSIANTITSGASCPMKSKSAALSKRADVVYVEKENGLVTIILFLPRVIIACVVVVLAIVAAIAIAIINCFTCGLLRS